MKPNGCLVYSTCTVTLAENEGIVAWALKKFPELQLERGRVSLGGPGLAVRGLELTDDQLCLLQRFGSNDRVDSDGFFIASFCKQNT